MAVPDYQTLMLPMLRLLSDGADHTTASIRDALAERFELTDEDLQERIASGTATRFAKNVDWARHYLKRAAVIEAPARAVSRIAPRGEGLLGEGLDRLDNSVLQRYEEFQTFRGARVTEAPTDEGAVTSLPVPSIPLDLLNPEDAIRDSFDQYRALVAEELLERIMAQTPEFMERLVMLLMSELGYGIGDESAIHLGASGDGGVDGVISEDRLGLESVYVQAKRWQDPVGRPQVQAFAGSLDLFQAKKGVFITTSYFTKEAHDYVDRIEKKIALIDGKRLTDLMYETGLGVSTRQSFTLKQVDTDFFTEE